jgi:hypothetical protein
MSHHGAYSQGVPLTAFARGKIANRSALKAATEVVVVVDTSRETFIVASMHLLLDPPPFSWPFMTRDRGERQVEPDRNASRFGQNTIDRFAKCAVACDHHFSVFLRTMSKRNEHLRGPG